MSAIADQHADSTVLAGAHLFYARGCEYCHNINGYGGKAGPDLTKVGNRLSHEELTIRIVNGSTDMPAFGGILSKDDLNKLTAFLATEK
jgi:ubiquinol-cytochrome c reductase cytochrome b subunit